MIKYSSSLILGSNFNWKSVQQSPCTRQKIPAKGTVWQFKRHGKAIPATGNHSCRSCGMFLWQQCHISLVEWAGTGSTRYRFPTLLPRNPACTRQRPSCGVMCKYWNWNTSKSDFWTFPVLCIVNDNRNLNSHVVRLSSSIWNLRFSYSWLSLLTYLEVCSKTSVNIYQTMWCHIPGDSDAHNFQALNCCWWNLRSFTTKHWFG